MENLEGDVRTPCKYGEKCYQTNPQHFKKFSHPHQTREVPHPSNAYEVSPTRLINDKEENEDKKQELSVTSTSSKRSQSSDGEKPSKKQKSLTSYFKKTEEKSDAAIGLHSPEKSDLDEASSESHDSTEHTDVAKLYGMEMPKDFYSFWEFCKSLNSKKPTEAMADFGLELVGPYDVLSNKLKKLDRESLLLNQRYYYDPPEFMTLIVSDKSDGFHMGYYRDEPSEMPSFVGGNSAKAERNPYLISILGDNIFAAINNLINSGEYKGVGEGIKAKLSEWIERNDFTVEVRSGAIKKRDKKVVCKTFHRGGLVVPVVDDVGYRDLQHTDGELKKMFGRIDDAPNDEARLKAFEPLQEIVTLLQFANDECDYGMGLELGIDMFSFGSKYLHKTILSVLPLAYQLLGRDLYADIISAHLKSRKLTVTN